MTKKDNNINAWDFMNLLSNAVNSREVIYFDNQGRYRQISGKAISAMDELHILINIYHNISPMFFEFKIQYQLASIGCPPLHFYQMTAHFIKDNKVSNIPCGFINTLDARLKDGF